MKLGIGHLRALFPGVPFIEVPCGPYVYKQESKLPETKWEAPMLYVHQPWWNVAVVVAQDAEVDAATSEPLPVDRDLMHEMYVQAPDSAGAAMVALATVVLTKDTHIHFVHVGRPVQQPRSDAAYGWHTVVPGEPDPLVMPEPEPTGGV